MHQFLCVRSTKTEAIYSSRNRTVLWVIRLLYLITHKQIRCTDWFYGSEGRESTEADRGVYR